MGIAEGDLEWTEQTNKLLKKDKLDVSQAVHDSVEQHAAKNGPYRK